MFEIVRARNVVRIEGVSLTIALAVAELSDGVLRHLRRDGDVGASNVSSILIIGIASKDVSAGGVEAERRAVVCVGHGSSVLVHGSLLVAIVDGLLEVLDAKLFGDCVRAAALAVLGVRDRECILFDVLALVALLELRIFLSCAEVLDGIFGGIVLHVAFEHRVRQRVTTQLGDWICIDREAVVSAALCDIAASVENVRVVLA